MEKETTANTENICENGCVPVHIDGEVLYCEKCPNNNPSEK